MSLADLFPPLTPAELKRIAHNEACARYRKKNRKACNARARKSQLKAKRRKA